MNRRSLLQILCFSALTAGVTGCSDNSRARYIPQATKARDALQAALDKWKSGAKHRPIVVSENEPVINVFDARWPAGKKLDSFEILEEIKNADQPQFKVSIKLSGEPEETNVYLVIGIDPLNVFRDEDYVKAQSM